MLTTTLYTSVEFTVRALPVSARVPPSPELQTNSSSHSETPRSGTRMWSSPMQRP